MTFDVPVTEDINLPPKAFASFVYAYRPLSVQAIPAAVVTVLQLNTRRWDILEEFNTATFSYTPRQTGFYLMYATCYWTGVAAAQWISLYFYLNGSIYAYDLDNVLVNDTHTQKVFKIDRLVPTDVLNVRVQCTAGKNIQHSELRTYLNVKRLM